MEENPIRNSEHELQQAVSRSQTYQLFGEALEYPNEDSARLVRNGTVASELEALFSAAAPALRGELGSEALADAGEDDDSLAVEYTRLFDVGASGPPCPLFGGSYGARMKTMEEVVRFYEHFGLITSQTRAELPDHLATELEFLHFLTFSEAQALEAGTDPEPFRRAQRDFLTRHPGNWVPQLLERIEQHEPMAFYRELIRQLDRFLACELSSLDDPGAAGDPEHGEDSPMNLDDR
jgi:DMSO reductase family type II enzyme chaperone